MKQKLTDKDVYNFYKKHLRERGHIKMTEAALELGISASSVNDHVRSLIRKGLMVRRHHKLYVREGADVKVLDQRGAINNEANRKKADAGRAGAMALKKLSEETGIPRWAVGLGKDEKSMQARIEKIVEDAKRNGTYCHPRPKYVVLIGEKVS